MREREHRRKQGFTLAELLLTIGIMVVLAGISFVGLMHYQRKLKLLEMDGTAEELFMAAQNEMSMLEANGTLELLSGDALGLPSSASTDEEAEAGSSDAEHQYYALIHNAGETGESVGDGLLSYLLPFGVIDDTVRTDGNYRIEYDYTAKTVTAVYYSRAASFLSGAGDAYAFKADGSDTAALRKAAGDSRLRQHFDGSETEAAGGAIVGYYGGGGRTVPEGNLTAPVLTIENGARLLLHIRMPAANKNVSSVLYIRGKDSGAELTASLGDLSNVVSSALTKTSFSAGAQGQSGSSLYMAKLSSAGEDNKYLLSLDSVTEQDGHFASLFPALMPGEDIEVYLKCSSTDGYALEVKSNTVSANSLFASVETETVSDGWTFDGSGMASLKENSVAAVPTAMIANVRHLENLDPAISGLSADTAENCIQAAVQTGDLVYAETSPVTDYEGQAVQTSDTVNSADVFTSDIGEYSNAADSGIIIYDRNGNAAAGYRPIQNAALLSYDGRGNAMVNFASGTAASVGNGAAKGQGIFAGISGQKDAKPVSIRDLRLLNCRFSNTEGAAAGALIGVAGNSHQLVLQGIETENCQMSSAGNVGGLVGAVEADGTDSAAVKLYVNECGILGEYGSVSGSNAGGLIGSLMGSAETKIANSTASVYVAGSSNAGGFIGEISGKAEIRFSYVGGHTKDGSYPEDSAEGVDTGIAQGCWNVQSPGNAGGFIGEARSVNLNLIGCYTTASVQSDGSAGAFLAAVSGSGAESVSYCYAAGKVSGSNQLPDTVKNLAAEGKDYKGAAYARPYDDALKSNGANPQYPYMTTAELYAAALADHTVSEVSSGSRSLKYGSKHIGDFCPEKETTETFLRFLNGPRLYAEVFTPLKENKTNYLTMVLTGTAETDVTKENVNCFQFSAEVQPDNTVTLTRIASPNSSEKHMQYNEARIVSAADKKYLVYRILLDDISVSYMHFSDITKDIRVGSNITGYAVAEKKNKQDAWYTEEAYLQASVDTELVQQLLQTANADLNLRGTAGSALEQYVWDSESTAVYDSDNSLFGRNSTALTAENNGHTACILSCRHLENLDHYVSKLENANGKRDIEVELPADANAFSYQRAVQENDLDWDQYIAAVGENGTTFCIYKPSSDTAITDPGCFYGIQNLLLTEYNGNYHSIANLRMKADANDSNAAGLFAAVPSKQQSGLTIHNLALRSVNSLAVKKNNKKNSAAALVGYYGSSKGLTIQNVVIGGAEIQSDMDAGGLLGFADGSGLIRIQNCAVYEGEKLQDGTRPYSLLISSAGGKSGRNNTDDSASAGGLIGRIPSNTGLSVSISGCSVYGEKALILAKGIGKDSDHTDDSAGGLVGTILSGSLNIDNCGVAAYIYAPNGDCTGGLVGDFSADGSMQNSYVAALTNATATFTDACAIDLSKLYTDTDYPIMQGGYTVYGHLATGGLVGYINRKVSIQNCFMTASVSVNAGSYSFDASSRNQENKTKKYFFGGLLGQLGAGTDGAKIVNCYVAGRIFDPSSGNRNLFMGSVLGYSMSNVNNYFYDANTNLTVYCLSDVSFTENSSRFIGGQSEEILTRSKEKQYQSNANGWGYSQTKIYGLQALGLDSLKPTGSTASSIPLNTSLGGTYPLLTWTRLYTPTEILDGSTDLTQALLRYIGDWCF